MTTIYEKANAECHRLCNQIMEQYHGELSEVGVTIDLLFATIRAEDIKPGAVTLKLHGYPVAAYVKINTYKLRVQGHADAEIVIDNDRWGDMSYEEKVALLDHELEHLEVKRNKEGELLYDDLGRIKLAMKPHDHQFGWFDCIARRHGEASGEVRQFYDFRAKQPTLWKPEPPEQVEEE